MTEKLPSSIQNLRELAPKLNAHTDRANAVVRDVEKFLNEDCGLGIPEKVFAFSRDDNDTNVYLAYMRVAGKYRIAVCEQQMERDAKGNLLTDDHTGELLNTYRQTMLAAWSDCSRGDKLGTFKVLPDLLNLLAVTVGNVIQQTETTAETVDAVMAALKSPTPPPMVDQARKTLAQLQAAGDAMIRAAKQHQAKRQGQ